MEHPIIEYLTNNHGEDRYVQEVLKFMGEGEIEKAKLSMLKIQAVRDIKFDLLKIAKEGEPSKE